MKAILTLTIVMLSMTAMAQDIHLTLDPISKKTGILINKEIHNVGLFTSASYGEVDNNTLKYQELTISAGLSYEMNEDYSVLLGYTRNKLTVDMNLSNDFEPSKIKKNSFSVGFLAHMTDYLSVSAMTDPLNWQTHIGIGISF